MMIGWPTLAPWRSTSRTKPGLVVRTSLNFLLKTLTHRWPHDGVAALAGPAASVPAAPPTRVSVAAAASILLLKDMDVPFLEPQPYPAHGCCCRSPSSDRNHSGLPGLHRDEGDPGQGGNGRPDR